MRPSTQVKLAAGLGGIALLAGLIVVLPRAARWLGGATSGLQPHETAHFVIYTSDDADAVRIANVAETFSRDFVARHGEKRGFALPDPPVSIYSFDTHEGLAGYAKLKLGQWLDYNGGYFSEKERALALIRGHDDALRHELTHMMVALAWRGAEVSPWFSEGQAQWFETGAAGSFPSEAAARAKRMLGAEKPLTLAELLEAPESAFASAGNAQPYALSAALYAWLATEKPEALDRVIELERKPGRAKAAEFWTAAGGTPEATESAWRAWVLRER